MSKPQLGIQLYSVRDRSERDFLGTIREMAEIGYRNVELAGIFGHSAREVRQTLDDAGLKAPSAHIGLPFKEPEKIGEHLKQQIEIALEIGLKRFIVPAYPLAEVPTEDDVAKFAAALQEAGETVKAAGLEFGYHNHAFEFKTVNGKAVIDHLLERVSPDLLFAEFDLGWVKVGGQDPAAYVRKYAGRVPVVHAKDFKDDGVDTEIGRGSVDWDSALAACEETGVEYVIIEQERYDVNSLESAKLNYAWFKARGYE
ncbi:MULTISPECIES: sugar phosphate isomerase/epimerase family protein [Cohnella]|uniref:sugar phosphate isomerase/epimerase family protein n=1 Tax=Cohnella TaxID=329857 RepID=UPI0009BA9A7B|nr:MULTISPECIES: sugar phosphate isomerase/epimerase [Cohnella]MBN2981505.1 sugar phosphate isomerase/epimerase [Cohnella algarum]